MDKKKASLIELKDLSVRLDKFSDLEHMNYLKHVLLPRIEEYSGQLDAYINSYAEMKEVVQVFDKTISIKANKDALTIFKNESD